MNLGDTISEGWGSLRVLSRMAMGRRRLQSTAASLEDFYRDQAADYDRTRDRMLHGRRELIAGLRFEPGSRLIELGGGTGQNFEFIAEPISSFASLYLIDLCPSLLAIAKQRFRQHHNLWIVQSDASRFRPAEPMDVVLLSYALTMMPNWREVIDNAHSMLRVGGRIAVVDFYAGDNHVESDPMFADQPWQRWLWPKWFAHDGVELDAQRIRCLRARFATEQLSFGCGTLPWLPRFLTVPHYQFVGIKSA